MSVGVLPFIILKHSQYVYGRFIIDDAAADGRLVLSATKTGCSRTAHITAAHDRKDGIFARRRVGVEFHIEPLGWGRVR
jgi:hypothetical protein